MPQDRLDEGVGETRERKVGVDDVANCELANLRILAAGIGSEAGRLMEAAT